MRSPATRIKQFATLIFINNKGARPTLFPPEYKTPSPLSSYRCWAETAHILHPLFGRCLHLESHAFDA